MNHGRLLEEILTFSEVKSSHILHCCIIEDMLYGKDRKLLLSDMITLFELHIENHTDTLQSNCKQLIAQLESYMTDEYINTCNSSLSLQDSVLEDNGIITWLELIKTTELNERFPGIARLIKDLKREDETCAMLLQFQEQVKMLLGRFKQKLTREIETVDSKNLLMIRGAYANTAEILYLLELDHADKDIDEIRIIVNKLIVVNADIISKGTNLIIVTDLISVNSKIDGKPFSIDTSGRHGTMTDERKAEDGQTSGKVVFLLRDLAILNVTKIIYSTNYKYLEIFSTKKERNCLN